MAPALRNMFAADLPEDTTYELEGRAYGVI